MIPVEGISKASSGTDVLDVQEVTVRFGGITALERVSLDVAGGEVLGVIGPNGAGKTTLFNCISGFVRPQSGTISWRGQRLERMRPDRLAGEAIARTLQGVGLFSGLTVAENVMIGAERFRRTGLLSALLALPRSERDERGLRERALAALRAVGCEDVADRRPGSLPFATQKRVAFARALAAEPVAAAARRAGGWPRHRRARAARDADTQYSRGDERDPRGAPHGLRHVRLRPSRRARLRSRDLHRTAGDGALGSARARGVPRRSDAGHAGHDA